MPELQATMQDDKREAAVDLHFAEQTVDDVTYRLPAGYQVKDAPQSIQIPWPALASLAIENARKDDQVEIKRTFVRAFALLDAKEFPAMSGFAASLTRANQAQVVLTQVHSDASR